MSTQKQGFRELSEGSYAGFFLGEKACRDGWLHITLSLVLLKHLVFHAGEDFGAIKAARIVSKHGKFTIT